MKASKFSDAQKAFNLKQGAGGVPVPDICRKAGINHLDARPRPAASELMLLQSTSSNLAANLTTQASGLTP